MLPLFNKLKNKIKNKLFQYSSPEFISFLRYINSKKGVLTRNGAVVTELKKATILVLSPHPDDEVIGLGGSIILHQIKGSHITVLYMTDGRHESPKLGISKEQMIKKRRSDAELLKNQLKIDQIFWDIEDNKLTNDSKTVNKFIKLLEKIKPQIIYLPSFFDFNHDHFAANQILFDSLLKSPDFKTIVNGYEVWNNIPFPNYIVDISPYFKEKEQLLSVYTTSLKAFDYLKLIRQRNGLNHSLFIEVMEINKNNGYAEAFYRMDSDIYITLYKKYLCALREFDSNLPKNIKFN